MNFQMNSDCPARPFLPKMEEMVPKIMTFAARYFWGVFWDEDRLACFIDSLTIDFNDHIPPRVEDTLSRFWDLVDELIRKYENSNIKEGQELSNELNNWNKYVKNQSFCGESFYGLLYPDFSSERIKQEMRDIQEAFWNAFPGQKIPVWYVSSKETINVFTRNLALDEISYIKVLAEGVFMALLDKAYQLHGAGELRTRYYHEVVDQSLMMYLTEAFLENEFGIPITARNAWNYNCHPLESPIFVPHMGYMGLEKDDDFWSVYKLRFSNYEEALRKLIQDRYAVEIILKKEPRRIIGLSRIERRFGSRIVSEDCYRGKETYLNGMPLPYVSFVYEIIRQCVEERGYDLYHLAKAFPDEIQGTFGVFQRTDEVAHDEDLMFRYYKVPLIACDGIEIVVCNQWSYHNIWKFVKKAKKLGFDVCLK